MKKTITTSSQSLAQLFTTAEQKAIMARYSEKESVNVLITPATPGATVYIENYLDGNTVTPATSTDSTPINYGSSLSYSFKVFETTTMIANINADVRFLFI